MVDGDKYGRVMIFCYLSDTLDGDGGVDLAVTSRIRNGWMKFRELLPFLASRTPPLEMKGRSRRKTKKDIVRECRSGNVRT